MIPLRGALKKWIVLVQSLDMLGKTSAQSTGTDACMGGPVCVSPLVTQMQETSSPCLLAEPAWFVRHAHGQAAVRFDGDGEG